MQKIIKGSSQNPFRRKTLSMVIHIPQNYHLHSLDCQKQFIQFSSFQKHKRIHTGEKPYKCDHCQQSFTQISNLNRHLRFHTKEKPYKCNTCTKAFSTSSNLKQHLLIHQEHKDRIQYECPKCQKQYFYVSTLKKHERNCQKQQQQQLLQHTFIDNFDLLQNSSNFFYAFQYPSPYYLDSDQDKQKTMIKLQEFFTCKHLKISHSNHIDILFNGFLYFYNEETGKIETHNLDDVVTTPEKCEPVSELNHHIKKEFEQVTCQQCKKGECCCSSKKIESCCLACNGGACKQQEEQEEIQKIEQELEHEHEHGPNCGHPIVHHNGHIDYLVNETLHYPNGSHCYNHGILKCIEQKI